MKRFKGRGERMILMEITPMIDVVFLLIVFFMTTAQFAQLTRAEVELPKEKGEQQPEPEEAGLVINVTAEGEIIVASATITIDELDAAVSERMVETLQNDMPLRVLLRADRNADTSKLNQIISRLQELGVGSARVATEVPN